MCRGGRLIADFTAGTVGQPDLPAEIGEHLTRTVDGLWVVWAHKLARQQGELFVPLTGGPGYPADARAVCRPLRRRMWTASTGNEDHDAPDPGCTCGFHALSSPELRGLPPVNWFAQRLTVGLSGRVLAFEWPGGGVLWRAERQTVVRVQSPEWDDAWSDYPGLRRRPDDPEGDLSALPVTGPHDSGPVRLTLPASPPVLSVCRDDAGWCEPSRAHISARRASSPPARV